MNMQSFIRRLCRSQIPNHSAVILVAPVALAWSDLAICGEIHKAARDGDVAKVQALL
jgi:hypothetical protein